MKRKTKPEASKQKAELANAKQLEVVAGLSGKAERCLNELMAIAETNRDAQAEEAVIWLWQIMEDIEEFVFNVALAPAEPAQDLFRRQTRLTAGSVLGIHYNRIGADLQAMRKAGKFSNVSRSHKLVHGVEGCPSNEAFCTCIEEKRRGGLQSPFALWCYRLLGELDRCSQTREYFHHYEPKSHLFRGAASKRASYVYCHNVARERFEAWVEAPAWVRQQPPGSGPATWKNYVHTFKAVFDRFWSETHDGSRLE